MNIQFFLEKLKGSEEFKKFKKENPKCYLTSCFITLDIEGKEKNNQYHLDFFVPASLKMENELGTWWSFKLENGIELEEMNKGAGDVDIKDIPGFIKDPPKISAKSQIEFDEILRLIQEEMDKRKISNKIQKILMVLQKKHGVNDAKELYVCTIFISGLGILKVILEDTDDGGGKILEFEKRSFFEMIRRP